MITLDQAGAGKQGLRMWAPAPQVQGVIEHGGVVRHDPCPIPPTGWRIVPDLSAHLMAVWGGDGDGWQAGVVGARTVHVDASNPRRRAMVFARFRPGVLPHILRDRADVLTDRVIPLDALPTTPWTRRRGGTSPAEASRRLLGLGPNDVGQVWSTLAGLVPPDAPVDPVVQGAGPRHSLQDLATSLGVSARTLRRRVQEHVGVSLRRAHQIQRLYRALEGLAVPAPRLSHVALGAGYADQPHMIRDFRALLGETPTAWMARRGVKTK